LSGSEAGDHLHGAWGDDEIEGREGKDTLIGSQGADTLYGGDGRDTIDYSRELGLSGVRVFMLRDEATDTRGGVDLIQSIEDVIGTDFTDEITGDVGDNTFWGGLDRDILGGGEGDDTLYGGKGDDVIGGNADKDKLFGGDGKDVMNGGEGADQVFGGAKDDRLFGGQDHDSLYGGDGDDFLRDNDEMAFLLSDPDDFIKWLFDGGKYRDLQLNMLLGVAGNDIIEGPGLLSGGSGNDTLTADFSGTLGTTCHIPAGSMAVS
jgi:Ca2+-binding RTX toxin-like protein